MIIAVDFDGTCVEHRYPEIGGDIGAAPVLRRLIEKGHRLILFTMRSGDELREAEKWFELNDIPLYGVQKNPTQHTWTESPKAYAQLYIDDAALGVPLLHPINERPYVDWEEVEEQLEDLGLI